MESIQTVRPTADQNQVATPWIDCRDQSRERSEIVQSIFLTEDLSKHFFLDQDGLFVTT